MLLRAFLSLSTLALVGTAALATPSWAQGKRTPERAPAHHEAPAAAPAGPKKIGDYGNWTAAVDVEGGAKVCYAFARPARSEGKQARQNVILVVTQRPQGRDQVALRAGYTYPRNAAVQVAVGPTKLDFYTSRDSAFAREGHAAVAAFRNGREAVSEGPGANGRGKVTDTFSLSGFGPAYEAISKECPPTRR